jgi:hypothetical protein
MIRRRRGALWAAAVVAAVFAALSLSSFAFAASDPVGSGSESSAQVAADSGPAADQDGLPFTQLDLALAVGGGLVLLGAGALTARFPAGRH